MPDRRNKKKIVSVILAAGKGTRMRGSRVHKVCITLEGVPVIVRAIETYQQCGIESHFIVVGLKAEQVMQTTAGLKSNLFFCFQPEQFGTGNATKVAAKLLSAMEYNNDVLVVAGDKLIDYSILQKLINNFYETESDLTFLVGKSTNSPNSGRIVYLNANRPVAIVEVFDIAKVRLLQKLKKISKDRLILANETEKITLDYLKLEKKAALALGGLWDLIKNGTPLTEGLLNGYFSEEDFYIHVNGNRFAAEFFTEMHHANLSVYMFKAKALYYALERLSTDNAQREEYLTDTVEILAASNYKLCTVPVNDKNQVLSFNTPEELENLRKCFAMIEK